MGTPIWGQKMSENFLYLLFLSLQTPLNKEWVTGRFSETGSADAVEAAAV